MMTTTHAALDNQKPAALDKYCKTSGHNGGIFNEVILLQTFPNLGC